MRVDVDQHSKLPPVVRPIVVGFHHAAEVDLVGLAVSELKIVVAPLLLFLNAVLIVGIVEVVDRGFPWGHGRLRLYPGTGEQESAGEIRAI